jgi:anti-sigma B factor antagonist
MADLLPQGGTFRVWTEADGQALVVRAFGELDLATAGTLEEELRKALASDGSGVVLDLGEVEFIDSTALGVLIAIARLNEDGFRFSIRRQFRPAVRQALDLTGISDRLPFTDRD